MFLKFCVTNAINEFIKINGLKSHTLTLFERGAIDKFMPVIKQRRLDAEQGAMLIILGTITNTAQSGALSKLKEQTPYFYDAFKVLWDFCSSLLIEDEHRWDNVVLGGVFLENPFLYAKQCA